MGDVIPFAPRERLTTATANDDQYALNLAICRFGIILNRSVAAFEDITVALEKIAGVDMVTTMAEIEILRRKVEEFMMVGRANRSHQ